MKGQKVVEAEIDEENGSAILGLVKLFVYIAISIGIIIAIIATIKILGGVYL